MGLFKTFYENSSHQSMLANTSVIWSTTGKRALFSLDVETIVQHVESDDDEDDDDGRRDLGALTTLCVNFWCEINDENLILFAYGGRLNSFQFMDSFKASILKQMERICFELELQQVTALQLWHIIMKRVKPCGNKWDNIIRMIQASLLAKQQ